MSLDAHLLVLENVAVNYGQIQALRQFNLTIQAGECITLIGANGAGKSTTLKAISRLVPLSHGQILYQGRSIHRYRAEELVSLGLAHVPEGRRILSRLTVLDNLKLGAYCRHDRREIKQDLAQQFSFFPRLAERQHQLAGTLSGGEQQMLALARALMSRPKLLLLDEPSLGLAPVIVQEIFSILKELRQEGISLLLVEQNANLALAIADRGYVIESGELILSGNASDLAQDQRVKQAYLG
ncbi:ABC transporter ATP-binding protein [Synechococcus sp. PCC 6312]|uniref:ABC transporter ATP-binding protein n=1 Tax=Synechococcus sp. (strain ATCC 27167 / PCC 6312) TaxID=195253 RepID=UPI00029F0E76|nr:ABC transporter ATP-binding protein [Synechococcus sp. PCC 6312]AFY61662.1 amino acid/amide ABC transporter ATP-binding protein 2, HAAT family [Synechococcus sp. PCC 6312]